MTRRVFASNANIWFAVGAVIVLFLGAVLAVALGADSGGGTRGRTGLGAPLPPGSAPREGPAATSSARTMMGIGKRTSGSNRGLAALGEVPEPRIYFAVPFACSGKSFAYLLTSASASAGTADMS